MRFVVANGLVILVYAGLGAIDAWIEAVLLSPRESLHGILFVALMIGTLAVVSVINWWLLRIQDRVWRILAGLGLGLLVFHVAFFGALLAFVFVHVALGGTL